MFLSASKILVVEDSFLLAEAIAELVRDWGMEPVGPVGRLEEACRVARERALDGAILDVKLDADFSYPVASILNQRGIPFIFLTAYARERTPLEFRGAPFLHKPFDTDELRDALASLPAARWRQTSASAPAQPTRADRRDVSEVQIQQHVDGLATEMRLEGEQRITFRGPGPPRR